MIIVVDVGCLECGNESDLMGLYPDMATALAAHPEAIPRGGMDDDSWRGSGLTIAFDSDSDNITAQQTT